MRSGSALLPPLAHEATGRGPGLLLIHGTATDRSTWARQMRSLRQEVRLVRYDRRGTPAAPLPEGIRRYKVAGHAADARDVGLRAFGGRRFAVCGSSFGAVIALELALRWPDLVAGALLCEPPLRHLDPEVEDRRGWLDRYEGIRRQQGGPAAARFFLASVLGGDRFEGLHPAAVRRAEALHEAIDHDIRALVSYRLDRAALARLACPVVLLLGERSPEGFHRIARALAAALADARIQVLRGVGHMMHVEDPVAFDRAVSSALADWGWR